MDERILEELREQYVEAIELLQDEEEIKNSLPQPGYTSFYTLTKKILERIEEEVKTLLEIKETETDLDTIKEIDETIALWNFKKEICFKQLEEAQKEEEIIKEISTKNKINIIFATNLRGTYLENDLKDIPNEWYDSVIELLERLQNGDLGELYTNHDAIKKVYKLSAFKVRLVFKILDGDTVFVMRIKMKKSNNDKSDLNDIISRSNATKKEFEYIKEKIKIPEEKQKLIEENEKILETLTGHIKQNKRG